jgi:hypothetical protein
VATFAGGHAGLQPGEHLRRQHAPHGGLVGRAMAPEPTQFGKKRRHGSPVPRGAAAPEIAAAAGTEAAARPRTAAPPAPAAAGGPAAAEATAPATASDQRANAGAISVTTSAAMPAMAATSTVAVIAMATPPTPRPMTNGASLARRRGAAIGAPTTTAKNRKIARSNQSKPKPPERASSRCSTSPAAPRR